MKIFKALVMELMIADFKMKFFSNIKQMNAHI